MKSKSAFPRDVKPNYKPVQARRANPSILLITAIDERIARLDGSQTADSFATPGGDAEREARTRRQNITLNTYSHIIKSKEAQAANKMDIFYSKAKRA